MIGALVLAGLLTQVGTGLDCAKGFDALTNEIRAKPGLKAYAGADPTLKQWYDAAGNLYAVTSPEAAAHPVVIKRVLSQGVHTTVDTSACAWGDKAALDALMAEIERLNAALIARYGG